MIKFLLKLVFWFGIFTATNLGYMVNHENVHAAICKGGGGEPRIEWGLPISRTYCSVGSDKIHELNAWNEIVGYNMQTAFSALLVLALYFDIREDLFEVSK